MSDAAPDRNSLIARMDEGTAFFSEQLGKVNPSDYDGPSLLEGWSRRILIAHVIRNAMALTNLCMWALTGDERPMYASPEDRQRGIDAQAALSLEEQRRDFDSTAAQFREYVGTIEDENRGDFIVRTARGREVPAREVVVMRSKEVWIHGVDLNMGAHFERLPDDYLVALFDELAPTLSTRAEPASPAIRVVGRSELWNPGEGGSGVVRGPLSDVVGWLSGRSKGDGLEFEGVSPVLKPWF